MSLHVVLSRKRYGMVLEMSSHSMVELRHWNKVLPVENLGFMTTARLQNKQARN